MAFEDDINEIVAAGMGPPRNQAPLKLKTAFEEGRTVTIWELLAWQIEDARWAMEDALALLPTLRKAAGGCLRYLSPDERGVVFHRLRQTRRA